jgi:hypothetical protein
MESHFAGTLRSSVFFSDTTISRELDAVLLKSCAYTSFFCVIGVSKSKQFDWLIQWSA